MIYSFDIFDTCITRRCGKPDNVFFLLAKEVMLDRSTTFVLDFIRERKLAEKEALERHPEKQDVNIDEIYECFDVSLFTSMPKEFVKNKEIEIELNSFAPIRQTMDLIDDCRQKGRVIFISDMYLPYDELYNKLKELNVIQGSESFYLSNKIGKTKRHGDLFDYVKEKENINVKQWTHFGDNIHADYKMPKSKGIRTSIITYSPTKFEALWESEANIIEDKSLSVFSGIANSLRLEKNQNNDEDFVFDLMAPLITSFALCLLEKAKRDGVKKLYFAARDMYVVYIVAKRFSSLFPEIELNYLYISTKVLYPTYIIKGTEDELIYLFKLTPKFKPLSYLKILGYNKKEIDKIGSSIDLDKYLSWEDNSSEKLIKLMLEEKDALTQRCLQKRILLKDYLRQEGVISDNNAQVAIADIGWRGTSQAILNYIFPNNSILFYYYGISETRLSIHETGTYYAFSHGEYQKDFYSKREFLEYYICRNAEGTTIGYKIENGKTIVCREECCYSKQDIQDINNNIDNLISFADSCKSYTCILSNTNTIFYNCMQRTLQEFIRFPSYPLVKKIAPFMKFNHWGYERNLIIKLPKLYHLSRLWRGFLNKTKICKRREPDFGWFEASYIFTYKSFGEWVIKHKIMQIPHKLLYFLSIK